MDTKLFWLVLIEDSKVVVSLNKNIGLIQEWTPREPDSLARAVDISLSDLAQNSGIPEENEPDQASFVVPPLWINQENRILPDKLNMLENLCKSLHFKPIGFISYDEAILEDLSSRESFPCSFVLLHINHHTFNISIAYLGKISHRIQGFFQNGFDVADIEKTLFELKTNSALPPQIILLGDIDEEKIDAIRNYSWVGKRNIETFLHLPEVNFISIEKSLSVFTDVIGKQLSSSVAEDKSLIQEEIIEPEIELKPETKPEELEIQVEENNTCNLFNIFTQVDKESLGFSSQPKIEETKEEIKEEPREEIKEEIKEKAKITLKIPKLKLPKIKIPKIKNKILFLILPFLVISLLLYFFFYKAKVILYATPYEFNQKVNVSLSTEKETSSNNIFVSSKTISIPIKSSIPTTGIVVIGEKAKGEVTIYNKLETSFELKKGSIFLDNTGKNFILLNNVSVPSSTNDLEEGIIKLGQVKAVLEAGEIGPEYNIDKDISFKTKDNNSNIIVKSEEAFTGGTKEEVRAVDKQDIVNLENIIKEDINQAVAEKVEKETATLAGAILESLTVSKQKITFNRNPGEQIDELVGEVDANVSIFILDPEDKQKFILETLKSDEEFNRSILDLDKITLSFDLTKIDTDSASGSLSLNGNLLPKIDIGQFKRSIKGKSFQNLNKIIQSNGRIYNHKYVSNMKFFDFIKLLPFSLENISIDVKL